MPTYIYAPNGIAQGVAWVAPPGVTLAQAWPNSAADWIDITALSAAPVPGSTYTNGVWTAPVASSTTPSNAQLAAQLQAAGLTLTCTSNPALSGVYALDTATQQAINATSTYILTNPGKFPGGQTSLVWLDVTGSPKTFTSTATFQEYATATANVVAELDLYAAGQGSAPTMSVTIS